MNNPKSVLYGWAALTAAGAFAYYVAKQEIDQRRQQYAAKLETLDWEQKLQREEAIRAAKNTENNDVGKESTNGSSKLNSNNTDK